MRGSVETSIVCAHIGRRAGNRPPSRRRPRPDYALKTRCPPGPSPDELTFLPYPPWLRVSRFRLPDGTSIASGSRIRQQPIAPGPARHAGPTAGEAMRGRSRRLCGVLWIRGKREMFSFPFPHKEHHDVVCRLRPAQADDHHLRREPNANRHSPQDTGLCRRGGDPQIL